MDPPFYAAWDPVPRRHFDATLVQVETDEGITGYGSGDTMDGFEPFEPLFTGRDPLNVADHVKTIESIGFHAGRYAVAALREQVGLTALIADFGITEADFAQIAADALDDEVLRNTPRTPTRADIRALLSHSPPGALLVPLASGRS